MIGDELKRVILQELELDEFPMNEETLASEVPGWDSLTHLRILSSIEKAFQIRFASLEIIRLKNIGELQILVDRKLAAQR